MSELILVRHGQASFGQKSYDKLSERGIEQVKILAQHWRDIGEQFDCIYSGTLLRQRETANELLSLVRGEPDESIENPSLNEYNGDPLMRVYLRNYVAGEGRKLDRETPIKDPRRFQELFEVATLIQTKRIEPFPMILFGKKHWRGLLNWAKKTLEGNGQISPGDIELMTLTDDVDEAVEILTRYIQENSGKNHVGRAFN